MITSLGGLMMYDVYPPYLKTRKGEEEKGDSEEKE